MYRTAAHFYQGAFADQPKLGADAKTGHRYKAACCAALAGCGEGQEAAKLDNKERSRWRQQALAWLQADLNMWSKQLESKAPQAPMRVRGKMLRWQQDRDLAGVRDAAALAKLPETERAAWSKLWAGVAEMLKRAGGAK
jgi:hypothetical protein